MLDCELAFAKSHPPSHPQPSKSNPQEQPIKPPIPYSPTHSRQQPLAAADITGIVLCGGRGLRMGGADKPLLQYQGKSLVEQVLARLANQVGRCIVSANRNLALYQQLADQTLPQQAPITLVTDRLANYQGPLAGIQAALQQCSTPWFLICPGDAPTAPHNLLDALSAERDAQRACVAHDGERQQQLHFLGHRGLLDPLTQYLESGRRSVAGFHEAASARSVKVGTPADFANINRPG